MGIVTRFPTSWENGGGNISNGPNGYAIDSSYMSVWNEYSSCRYLGFAAYTLPAGYTLIGYRMCIRYYFSASGTDGTLSYRSGSATTSLPPYLTPTTVSQSLMGWPLSDLPTNTLSVIAMAPQIINVDAVWFEIEFTHTPSVPASISYDSSFASGGTASLSCAASTDAGSDLAGYAWEVNYDGSGSWGSVGTSATNSKSVTLAAGHTSVQFRVRAYDSDGVYSSYRTGSTSTISTSGNPLFFGMNF